MAQGSVIVFNEFKQNINTGGINLNTDTINIMLISNSSVAATQLTPDSADFTQVSTGGTSYTGPVAITKSFDFVGTQGSFDLDANVSWTQDASGPTDIRYALVYSSTHAGTEDGICVIDLTVGGDGTTAISLVDGDITINAGNLFTVG